MKYLVQFLSSVKLEEETYWCLDHFILLFPLTESGNPAKDDIQGHSSLPGWSFVNKTLQTNSELLFVDDYKSSWFNNQASHRSSKSIKESRWFVKKTKVLHIATFSWMLGAWLRKIGCWVSMRTRVQVTSKISTEWVRTLCGKKWRGDREKEVI